MPQKLTLSIFFVALALLASCSRNTGGGLLGEGGGTVEKFEFQVEEVLSRSPLALSDLLELGILYQANDRFSDAVLVYESLLDSKLDGEFESRIMFYLALIDLEKQRADRAELRLKRAVKLYPKAIPALHKLGELSFNDGKVEEAVAWYSRMIENNPSDAYALLGRARAYLTIDMHESALSDLMRMREDNPEFKGGLGLLAQLLEESGEVLEASRVRREIVRGAVPPYPHAWLMQLRKSSFDTKVLGIYYEDYVNSGEEDVAVWFLDRIESLNPDDWNAKVLRGLGHAKDGKTDLALAQYRAALEKGADKSLVYPLIVKCLLLLGRTSEAVQFGEQGVLEIPNSVDLLVELAGATMVQLKLDRAAGYFDRALALNPYHEKALQYYAAMLVKQGKLFKAEDLLVRWIQISPADPSPYLERAFLRLRRGGSSNEILDIPNRLQLKWSDRSIAKLRDLGNALREKNKSSALRAYEFVNELRPEDSDSLIARVELLVQLKRVREAMELIDSLVRLQPSNLGVRIAAGDIYSMNGENSKAEREWRFALDLTERLGDQNIRKEILSRLRSL